MRVRRLTPLLSLVLATMAVACGVRTQPQQASPAPAESQSDLLSDHAVEAFERGEPGDPSSFEWQDKIFHFLNEDDEVIDASPWSACLGRGCWDGAPGLGGPIPSVGSPDSLWFALDYPGWTFDSVSFNPVQEDCGGRIITVRATPVTDRIFQVDPAGLRGEWRVDVFGRSSDGDAVTSVHWSTPATGTMPEPDATGSLFTDQDGQRVAPYGGPELHLSDLVRTPAKATASWTVTDSSGTTVAVPLRREIDSCARDGSVSFRGRELTADQLNNLTGPWVTYTVDLTLDGERYTGTARWPQDETEEAPYTRFTFDPPLPAYRG